MISLKLVFEVLKLAGMPTAKIVLFHKGSTELRRCENHAFFFPVNILTVLHASFLSCYDTLPCVLIHNTKYNIATYSFHNSILLHLSSTLLIHHSYYTHMMGLHYQESFLHTADHTLTDMCYYKTQPTCCSLVVMIGYSS